VNQLQLAKSIELDMLTHAVALIQIKQNIVSNYNINTKKIYKNKTYNLDLVVPY